MIAPRLTKTAGSRPPPPCARSRGARECIAAMLVLCLGCTSRPAPQSVPTASETSATRQPDASAAVGEHDPSRQALALADEYLTRRFGFYPESATVAGWPKADHGAALDPSIEAVRRWQSIEDDLLARARTIDAARLDPAARVSLGMLVEALEGSRASRPCREELWDVSSIGGWHARYAAFADLQPVGTPELRAKAIARVRAIGPVIDGVRANLEEGVRLGYVASRDNVDRVIEELGALLAASPREWPFAKAADRDPAPGFRDDLARATAESVIPAARRYRTYLVETYRARARTEPGVLALPGGQACYEGAVRRAVTLPVGAREVHDTGLAEVARIDAAMAAIAKRSFGTRDVPALLTRLRTDRRYTFRSAEQILDAARSAIARAQQAAPRWFGRIPAAPVVVEPFPAFLAASAPSDEYVPKFTDGKMSGIFHTDTFTPTKRARAELESIAFHEAVPGHHFQYALAKGQGDAVVPIARYLSNVGFEEGWALYSERLADEMGLYTSDLERMGQLASEALRAARLVVDSGMHAQGWSRKRAIDYVLAHTTLSPEQAASEVDRYAAWPGQATAYMMGALEIRRLRREAEQALGARFDVRGFHDVVLGSGSVTLTVLRDDVNRWVAGVPPGSR